MTRIHPLDILQGYRLGSRQATAELQRTDVPGIHIDFDVFKLVDDVQRQPGQAVILTGTAGDGKTYLAYRIMDTLGIDRATVRDAQRSGGYDQDGVFIDLDLSAGPLTDKRVRRLYRALSQPQRLTLVCANEGKLAEFENRLDRLDLAMPENVLRINLSRRALVSPEAWSRVLKGVLTGPLWDAGEAVADDSPLARNRAWLQDPGVAERLRRYLLLPYLLGEPITIRETLSFLAYALGGGLDSHDAAGLAPEERIRYLLFNTVFSEPEGYVHGGRAAPTEKLPWWLFRFDPADQASPEVDLQLLVELNCLDVTPPDDLLRMWRDDLVVREGETTDTRYRRRLERFMHYARRWYALASEEGFRAYFPFRHFERYLAALDSPSEALSEQIPTLIRGLNLLLSGGQVDDDLELKVFYLVTDGGRQDAAIYSTNATIDVDDFSLHPDLSLDSVAEEAGNVYLERLPRRLYLQYRPQPQIRLPVSFLLYEVLSSAASPAGGFPATLWSKERDTVIRFMSSLSRTVRSGPRVEFTIVLRGDETFNVTYRANRNRLTIS